VGKSQGPEGCPDQIRQAPHIGSGPCSDCSGSTSQMGEGQGWEKALEIMLGNAKILVAYDAQNDTTQTDLRCNVNNCGKQPTIVSNGPKTIHQIVCVEHGVLSQFSDQDSFLETFRLEANRVLVSNGYPPIEADTYSVSGDELKPPESAN
jgi:hypothetical protein